MTTSRLMHERLKGKRPDRLLDGGAVTRAAKKGEREAIRSVIAERPRPYKPKPLIATRRRMVTRCVGVPAVGKWPRERCPKGQLVRYTVRAGRPSPRCAECRVVRAWRAMFTYEDPKAVAEVVVRLARAGRIGKAVKKA